MTAASTAFRASAVAALAIVLTSFACSGDAESHDPTAFSAASEALRRDSARDEDADDCAAQTQLEQHKRRPLVPLLDCVEPAANGMLRAYWSYANPNPKRVTRKLGIHNEFTPRPKDRGQPHDFEPGMHARVFGALFPSDASLTWHLDDHVAVAGSDSPRCSSGEAGTTAGTGGTMGGTGGAGGCSGTGGTEAVGSECDPVWLASGWRGLDLAVDAENAYWVDYGSDTLLSVSLTGGPVTQRASTSIGAYTVAVDATNLYWVSWTEVMKLPLAGGQPVALATVPIDENGYFHANSAFDIAIDDSYLYYVDNEAGELRRVSLMGGEPIVLASGQVGGYGVAVDATNVYWTIRVDGGSLQTMPKSGGTPTTLASGQSYPQDIAVDATSVYWINAGKNQMDGAVLKVSLTGGTPVVLASEQVLPRAIAVDSANVYWVNNGTLTNDNGILTSIADGTLMSLPLNGGTAVVLARGQSQPLALKLDATHAYWLDYGDETSGASQVMKIALDRTACQSAGCP